MTNFGKNNGNWKGGIALNRQVYMKNYYKQNKKEILNKQHKYYGQNSKILNKKQKKYQKENISKLRLKRRIYMYNRRKKDKYFNISLKLRSRINDALNYYLNTGKIYSASKYGINYKAIINHLKPFPKDIKKYHIDHIKPLCTFNLENEEEIKKAFAPENHQWLLAQENLSKGGKYDN